MRLAEALPIAEAARAALAPFCIRCDIAGSIRRRCPEVGDVEIVCIPRGHDLFRFCEVVMGWAKVKGEPTGRYTQRLVPSPIAEEPFVLDLFMARPENWGLILSIRTGSARFSHQVLARGWCKAGYKSVGGMLRPVSLDGLGAPVSVREERDLFDLIGAPWVKPEERT